MKEELYCVLSREIGSHNTDIITKHCDEESISKIVDAFNFKNSENTFNLPVKPFSYIWIMTPSRYLNLPADTNLPENCQGIFTEACENCNYNNKECKTAAYAEEKWFYLDSPYLTLVLDSYGKTVFDNEADCLKACKEKYNPEYVDKLVEQYHNYRDNLIMNGMR